MNKVFNLSLENLNILIKEILNILENKNYIILLNGDLASGKTTLIKNIFSNYSVTSPTFTIQNCYENNIFHYDFYHQSFLDIYNLGLLEEFDKKGWHFIEWADNNLIKFLLKSNFNILNIEIEFLFDKIERKYSLNI